MAVTSDGSPGPVKGRMKYGTGSRKRRSSKARSSISGGSWDRPPFPLPLRQASYDNGTSVPTTAKVRHNQKSRLTQPSVQVGSPRVILALGQNSEQVRRFGAFVNIPSPFAKKNLTVAKNHDCPDPDNQEADFFFTNDTSNSIPKPYQYSSIPPPPPPPQTTFANEIHSVPDQAMNSYGFDQGIMGFLDAQTRAANLHHTRPEWMTWDFVDLFVTNLPPGIRTVDLWKNFMKEGDVDFIDIFVTRSGQKDTKARLRFRQVTPDISAQ
jgi:hypothetical protein